MLLPLRPKSLEMLDQCRRNPMFVPVAAEGEIIPVLIADLPRFPVPVGLTIAEYIRGMEALGCTFEITGFGEVVIHRPTIFALEEWRERANQLQAAHDRHGLHEVVVFLLGEGESDAKA